MDKRVEKPVKLIVNADDFGYFASVSRGILACARQGAVTATGVMANGPRFDEIIPWLHEVPQLDVGVHLNLTYGRPISKGCRRKFLALGGRFFPKSVTAGLILRKKLPLAVVQEEWRAQIERCLAAGLDPRFLNTHEHIHLLPGLVGVILALAHEYGIEAVRFPRTEWRSWQCSAAAVLRNLLFWPINLFNGALWRKNTVPVIGLGISGQLSLAYLTRRLALLQPGRSYELMCHPGRYDADEITDKRLCRFHAWQQELEVLTGDGFQELLQRLNIHRVGYRDL